MKKFRIGVYIFTILAIVLCCYVFFADNRQTQAGNLIVVLDAGHDDAHTGAAGNGLNEENLNLQIALACKNELETYEGVTVYMVRDTGTCPYGGQSMGSSTVCNKKRVEYAKGVGADVYVSLHNNSSANSSARGVSVYYPTTNYNYHCGVTGAGLARSIIDQLLTTGLKDRGISVRYSEDNSRYPDGSLADYYGVIKNSKLKGIPAIIVEHAFISNAQDARDYLSTYEKLWSLGVLDATGIAEYYGLKKKAVVDYSKASIKVFPLDSRETCLHVANVFNAESVQFGVWSSADGQNDLQIYQAKPDGKGNWTIVIPISNHGSEGEYMVDVYANQNIYIGQTTFDVKGPYAESVKVVQSDLQQGSFVVEIEKAFSGTEIDSVSAEIWNEAEPGKTKWIQATPMGAGRYQIPVDISKFNYQYGTYQIHTYIRDMNAIVKCVDTQSFTLDCPDIQIDVTSAALSAAYQVQANQIPYGDGITEVTVRVYPVIVSEVAVKPDDITSEAVVPEVTTPGAATPETVTGAAGMVYIATGTAVDYKASKNSPGSWWTSVYPAEIGEPGCYKIEIYGKTSVDSEMLLGEMIFEAVAKEQKLNGYENENGQTVWKGNGIEIISGKNQEQSVITVHPWCDYKSVRKVLEQSEGFCRDYIAYEVIKESVDEVQLIFDIPEHMQGKEIVVLQLVNGQVEPVVLESAILDGNDKVSIHALCNGIFVVAAKEEKMRGDADFNNKIELRDAQLVLRAALGIEKLDVNAEKYCDVDNSGSIDLPDAQLILKRALNIIDVL